MSFMKTLKAIGIVEDDQPKEAPKAKVPQMSDRATHEAEATSLLSGADPSPLDVNAVEEHMNQVIRDNPEFAPVSAFLTVADSMKNVIADEGTRFKAAAAASGVDSSVLVTAARSFSPVLAAECQKFEDVYVKNCEDKLAGLNNEATQLQSRIDELTAQLGQLSEQKTAIGQQIRDADVGLAKAKIDFKSVVSTVDKRYMELVSKITQHVGAGA